MEEIVGHNNVNDVGIYVIFFYINGIKTPVFIDDYLPVHPGTNKIAFCTSKSGEMWTSLVEKAWAKLHGSYFRIQAGLPYFAFNHLCKLECIML